MEEREKHHCHRYELLEEEGPNADFILIEWLVPFQSEEAKRTLSLIIRPGCSWADQAALDSHHETSHFQAFETVIEKEDVLRKPEEVKVSKGAGGFLKRNQATG